MKTTNTRMPASELVLQGGAAPRDTPRERNTGAGAIDVHVGGRVRMRRTLIHLSQERLAALLGVSFQQVQKYERGTNRVGASRLMALSHALDVPISFFFDDLPPSLATGGVKVACGDRKAVKENDVILDKRETFNLVRSYYLISDPVIRRQIIELIKALSVQHP